MRNGRRDDDDAIDTLLFVAACYCQFKICKELSLSYYSAGTDIARPALYISNREDIASHDDGLTKGPSLAEI